ncbi:class I SAM-dependent methyltransferase [Motiliproteus sediminis]|uniref:class I SAM-dependent methyltransferase n=1 Tax=Motiliproteus sediminis TaxID=1468178 RepID=UPI001AEFCB79|nr:class I SAM-dependent methyltransferase [Motiliproteus sediminis]
MDYSAKFWDRIAKRYARKPIADEATYQKKIALTQARLNPGMKVLEFGCGTGSTALLLAPHVAEYEAIDVSANMIAIAEGKLRQNPVAQLRFKQQALEEHQAEPQSLDAILGHSILHLLDNPQAAIEKVHRLLKPGGFFISSTACLSDGMRFFRYIGPIGKWLGLIPAVRVFSQAELTTWLQTAGFEIDYRLIPENNRMSCFIVASKADSSVS